MTSTTLTMDQLYRLNDSLTATLGEFGWAANTDDDDERLNDAVLRIASGFFPRGVYGEWCRDPRACSPIGHCPKDPTCAD